MEVLRFSFLAMDKPKRSIDLTNVGIVNIDKQTKLNTIFFVPILSPNYEKAIGVVTAGGEMNIVMLYDKAQINPETIEMFKQRSMLLLKNTRCRQIEN